LAETAFTVRDVPPEKSLVALASRELLGKVPTVKSVSVEMLYSAPMLAAVTATEDLPKTL